jgi:hypothetical protein
MIFALFVLLRNESFALSASAFGTSVFACRACVFGSSARAVF